VLYVPSLKRNLISSSTILSKSFNAIINHHGAVIKHKETDTVVLEAKSNGKMLEVQLNVEPVEEQVNYVKVDADQLQLLHCRLGHIGEARLRMMIKQLGGKLKNVPALNSKTCIQAKATRGRIGSGPVQRATKPKELIHSDVWQLASSSLCATVPSPGSQAGRTVQLFLRQNWSLMPCQRQ